MTSKGPKDAVLLGSLRKIILWASVLFVWGEGRSWYFVASYPVVLEGLCENTQCHSSPVKWEIRKTNYVICPRCAANGIENLVLTVLCSFVCLCCLEILNKSNSFCARRCSSRSDCFIVGRKCNCLAIVLKYFSLQI